MRKEFVIRGQQASGTGDLLMLSGVSDGYGFKVKELQLWPSDMVNDGTYFASLTRKSSYADPSNPNFSNEDLVATAVGIYQLSTEGNMFDSCIDHTAILTGDLFISCFNSSGGNEAINYQVVLESVKLSGSEEAVANYKQIMINDG